MKALDKLNQGRVQFRPFWNVQAKITLTESAIRSLDLDPKVTFGPDGTPWLSFGKSPAPTATINLSGHSNLRIPFYAEMEAGHKPTDDQVTDALMGSTWEFHMVDVEGVTEGYAGWPDLSKWILKDHLSGGGLANRTGGQS